MTRREFLTNLEAHNRDAGDFIFLPGPDSKVNPEGRVVITHVGDRWSVHVEDRGRRDLRYFDSESEACDYAFRRWVLWQDD